MDIPGVGRPAPPGSWPTSATSPVRRPEPVRVLDRHRTLDASSGDNPAPPLPRREPADDHVLHIAAIVQLRHDTPGRAYYLRKLAAGRPDGSLALPERRLSTWSTGSWSPTPSSTTWTRVREGTAGRLSNPARPTSTRTSTLRISHFPDPHNRRYTPTITTAKTHFAEAP